MSTKRRGLLAAAALVSGCAASVDKVGDGNAAQLRLPAEAKSRVVLHMTGPHRFAADWEPFKGEWRAAMRRDAQASSIAFETIEDDAPAPTGQGTLVSINVADYRYLTSGARYGFGIMTGNAFISAQVRFVDVTSGQLAGTRAYNTSSSAWQGIFSAMTDKQVQALSTEIVGAVRSAGVIQATPVAPQAAPGQPLGIAAAAKREIGQESYQVERMPEVRACNASPIAQLTGRSSTIESYAIACSNGDFLSVRCEFWSCKVLK